ncbi:FG-GAP repeat domain-containing protein [Actinacidiphila alni]|uniref:FG-GAP repeat domain-containing protein n=1 Tax=Actinacidiphila alni TaxID=380248 RepID=UPI003454F423
MTTLALPASGVAVADDSSPPNPPASEARAFDVAAQTGQRVEIEDLREETAETFANPDGSLTRRQYSTPVWSRYEGVWKKADATIVQHPDGTVGPASPSFGITFSGGGTGPLATMAKDGKSLSLTWPTVLPQPALEGTTALYRSVLPDVDLRINADVDGFSEQLIVKTPAAAANPAVKSIKLGVTAQGVSLDDDAADNLIAKDSAGNIVFSAPRPKMWQAPAQQASATRSSRAKSATDAEPATDPTATAPVDADVSGGTLTLTPDAAALAAADQFPLVIDPAFTGGYREKWAVVYSAFPGEDYPNGSGWHSDNPTDEPRVGYNGSGATRSFFAMNTDGLEGAGISNATFAVTETHSWGCDASVAGPTELWSSGSIDTTPTWNTSGSLLADKLDSASFAHGNPTFCPGSLGHDFHSTALTNYVQKASDNSWGTLVFALKAASGYEYNQNSFKRFKNNPALEVTYNYKPTVDSHSAWEGSWSPGGDGNKSVPCGDVIGNSGITLTAKLADKDRGSVTGEFSVTTSGGTAVSFSPSTDKVSSGQTASVTVPASKLANGTYTWKVRAKDEENTYSAYTAACSFRVDRIGPAETVVVSNTDGTAADQPTDKYQARRTVQLKLYNSANDLAGFCWSMDLYLSASSSRCSVGTWVNVGADHHSATITVTPSAWPVSTLHALAYDLADNHSPLDRVSDATALSVTQPEYVYAPGKDPSTGTALNDVAGDLNGDGYADMLATDSDGKLLLYAGDGTGKVAAAKTVGLSGWTGALIAHRGDLRGLISSTAAPDGYEDFVVRLADNKLYVYGNNGLGTPGYDTRRELPHTDVDNATDWRRIRQLITPGDIDQNTAQGHEGGNDLITIECVDDSCSNASLYLYTGNTVGSGSTATQYQDAPFDLGNRQKIGTGGWKDYTNLAVGDQNGDGVQDIVARDPSTGQLYLYPGSFINGTYSLGTRTVYGTASWQYRPHLASPGNVQGTIATATYTAPADPDNPGQPGATITYHQFQPTPGETYGDLWATTPADPNASVNYVDDAGAAKSVICPSGCLLFYPGGPTAHRSPHLVGTAAWDTSITDIF